MNPLPYPIGKPFKLFCHDGVDTKNLSSEAFVLEVPKEASEDFFGVIPFTNNLLKPFSDDDLSLLSRLYSYREDDLCRLGVRGIIVDCFLSLGTLRGAFLESGCRDKIIPRITVLDQGENRGKASPVSLLISAQSLGARCFLIKAEDISSALEILTKLSYFSSIPLILDLTETKEDFSQEFSIIKEETENPDFFIMVGEGEEVSFFPCRASFSLEKFNSENLVLASALEGFSFDEDFSLSELFSSEVFSSDDIFKYDEEKSDILQFYLSDKSYAKNLAIFSYILTKPVCFLSDDEEALISALYYYNGRALVNSDCGIEKERLQKICKSFGAVLLDNLDI